MVGAVKAEERADSIGDMRYLYLSDDDVVVAALMRGVEVASQPCGGGFDHRAVLLQRVSHSGELRRPGRPIGVGEPVRELFLP